MQDGDATLTCSDCGKHLSDVPAADRSLPPTGRAPCPGCGSRNWTYSVLIGETVETHDEVRYKGRHLGAKRPHIEGRAGASYHRATGQWNDRRMWLDRERDEYHEVIRDDSGTVLHKCDEPLSEHQGHGSARGLPPRTKVYRPAEPELRSSE